MSAPESSNPKTEANGPAGRVNRDGALSAPRLRLPDADIPNRPQLKVKPIGSRTAADAPKPSVRAGSLFDSSAENGNAPGSDTDTAAPAVETKALTAEPGSAVTQPREHPPKKVSLPAPEVRETGYAFATHRPAPAGKKAERAELAAVTRGKPSREVSAGFVLGVALIVIALVGGIMVARLGKRVRSLEARLGRLEAIEIEVLTADHSVP